MSTPRQEDYKRIRTVGSSYVISVTRMCREIGQVDGMIVKVILERVPENSDKEDGAP